MCLVQTEVKRRYTSRSRGRIAAAVNVIETGNTKEEEAGHGCYATTSSAAFSIPICAVVRDKVTCQIDDINVRTEPKRRNVFDIVAAVVVVAAAAVAVAHPAGAICTPGE